MTVTGTVGPSNLLVNFTSSSGSQLLAANPSGQATISGGTGNDPLTQLSFGLANLDTVTRAVFNINAATNGSVLINVQEININGGFFEDDFVVDANGENFFTVDAINGQFINLISLNAINGALFEGPEASPPRRLHDDQRSRTGQSGAARPWAGRPWR